MPRRRSQATGRSTATVDPIDSATRTSTMAVTALDGSPSIVFIEDCIAGSAAQMCSAWPGVTHSLRPVMCDCANLPRACPRVPHAARTILRKPRRATADSRRVKLVTYPARRTVWACLQARDAAIPRREVSIRSCHTSARRTTVEPGRARRSRVVDRRAGCRTRQQSAARWLTRDRSLASSVTAAQSQDGVGGPRKRDTVICRRSPCE